MNRILPLLFFSIVLISCDSNQDVRETILRLEASRTSCDTLLPYLKHPEPRIRTRAVEAIAKLQDAECREAVESLLSDLNHNVRIEAAFALGQMGDTSAEAALRTQLSSKDRIDVKVRIIEALGKIGTEASVKTLLKQSNNRSAAIRGAVALAFGRMARRDLRDQYATQALYAFLVDSDAHVRWKSAWALLQVSSDLDENPLMQALQDSDARVRMFAALMLGRLKSYKALDSLSDLLARDENWGVRVNAARALGNYPLELVANQLTLLDDNHHVRVAVLNAIGSTVENTPGGFRDELREHHLARTQLLQVMQTTQDSLFNPNEVGAALISFARLLGAEAVDPVFEFNVFPELQEQVVEALAATQAERVANIYEQEFAGARPPVKTAILLESAALPRNLTPQLFLAALQENDPVIVALAAEGLARDSLENRVTVPQIAAAYHALPKPLDAEISQMIFRAIQILSDEPVDSVLAAAQPVPDSLAQPLLESGADSAGFEYEFDEISDFYGKEAVIHTERGEIMLQLFADAAPLTVVNFVRLARNAFYDGLTFHRVVPNFVIQGGDPRGDGWGSPGYAIPSEFNKHSYARGTVGMASAGKDTEGSQFFITHSPQPHLDGRYTVFGRVTSGMETVDRIQEGDKILAIEIK